MNPLFAIRETSDEDVPTFYAPDLHFSRVSVWDRLIDLWHSWRVSRVAFRTRRQA